MAWVREILCDLILLFGLAAGTAVLVVSALQQWFKAIVSARGMATVLKAVRRYDAQEKAKREGGVERGACDA